MEWGKKKTRMDGWIVKERIGSIARRHRLISTAVVVAGRAVQPPQKKEEEGQ